MTITIKKYLKKIKEKNKKKVLLKAPAGLKPGKELLKLKKLIENFAGGNFVITLPKSSYKCPPAPYEKSLYDCELISKKMNINGKVNINWSTEENPHQKQKSI